MMDSALDQASLLPVECHACARPLNRQELDDIEAGGAVGAVVRHFGQAACDECCRDAEQHNRGLWDL